MCAICANKAHLWSSDLPIGFQPLDLGSLSRRSPGIAFGVPVGGAPGLLWDQAAYTATSPWHCDSQGISLGTSGWLAWDIIRCALHLTRQYSSK